MPTALEFFATLPPPGANWRGNFSQHLPAEDLAFDCQPVPLIIVEQDAFFAELLFGRGN
jgi:hypothetical protein